MVSGIVKWFNSRKGYGFITPDGTPEGAENADIFVHHTNIKMEGFRVLYQGDKVTFDIEDGAKGKEARNIEVTERAPRPKRRRGPRTDKEPSEEGDLDDKEPSEEGDLPKKAPAKKAPAKKASAKKDDDEDMDDKDDDDKDDDKDKDDDDN
jgi:CspA family cold shock protein